MALKFTKAAGTAKKGVASIKLVEGENRFRMVGELLARYTYFINHAGKTINMECLAFDRDLEKFTDNSADCVPEVVEKYTGTPAKDTKCQWGYVIQAIDRTDGQLKLLYLKKTMLEQIMSLAEDLGDPTDPEKGYDIIVERKKTGPKVYNVSYELKSIKILKAREEGNPPEDAEIIANLKPIDSLIPRPTTAEQRAQLEKFFQGAEVEEAPSKSNDQEAIDDLDDNIPF